MSDGRFTDDAWLNHARIELYEEMQNSGIDKFHEDMDKRVRNAAETYKFTVVKHLHGVRMEKDEEQRKAL